MARAGLLGGQGRRGDVASNHVFFYFLLQFLGGGVASFQNQTRATYPCPKSLQVPVLPNFSLHPSTQEYEKNDIMIKLLAERNTQRTLQVPK